MPNNCNCAPRRIYIAGPYYNNAEKTEQTKIAVALERNGFCTYLPQRDGLQYSKVYDQLISEGKTDEEARLEAPQIILNFNIFNLLKAAAIVANVNENSVDLGTSVLSAIAYSSCMPVIFYKDDQRTFLENAELDPILSGLKSVPFVRRIRDIPGVLRNALPKRDCKCISDAIKDAMRAGAGINRGRFR